MSKPGILLVLGLGLIWVDRLPAPISEETAPTPKPQPKREGTPKPRPKPEATPKPKPTPNRSFVGNWTGSVVCTGSDGNSGNWIYLIKISDDEKTAWINWDASETNLNGPGFQTLCSRFHGALTWSLTPPERMTTDTLQINANGTANFVREGSWTSGDNQGITFKCAGTLSRQDFSSAPSVAQTPTGSAPQTTATSPPLQTTTTVAPQIGEIPTARPVPDRPGFVYNPFDRTAKRLLDIRGKASGSKVKDPFSGRLFIVP
jgi:hypothetical protein